MPKENWITNQEALALDWEAIFPFDIFADSK